MTRLQRNFLAVAILALAWLLHFNLCDWHWKASVDYTTGMLSGDIVTFRHRIWAHRDNVTGLGIVTTGLTTDAYVELGTAIVWGIAIPFALVAGDIWWMLGWRRRSRLAAGCCAACGYNLKGSDAVKCPECGAARSNP